MAWLIVPDRDFQRALVLVGSGSNGKSTFLRCVENYLGRENISNVGLQQLSDRFASVALIGKLANISTDLPNTRVQDTSLFKAITGGDSIGAEYKFGKIFRFRPFTKLVFSANELPESDDTTNGYYRRYFIVPFDNVFENNPGAGRQLDEMLADDNELSGLLNLALDVLPDVRRRGLSITPSVETATEEYQVSTDPVQSGSTTKPRLKTMPPSSARSFLEHSKIDGLPHDPEGIRYKVEALSARREGCAEDGGR